MVYYVALFPNPPQPSFEIDLPNGPAPGSWYTFESAGAGGSWCTRINGTIIGCNAAFPYYAQQVDAGLEYSAPPPQAANAATTLSYRRNLQGQYVANTGSTYSATPPTLNWAHNFPASGYPGQMNTLDYSTLGCYPAARMLSLDPEPGDPPVVDSEGPAASYDPSPASKRASDRELLAVTKAFARIDAGESSPERIEATRTSLAKAAAALGLDMTASTQRSPGFQRWLDSPVALVTARGSFNRATAPRSPGAHAPSGSVLTLIIDTRTQHVDVISVGDSPARRVARLGRTVSLRR